MTRSLIHRPLLCHGSESASSAASIVLAAAGKHILQILDLLRERRMNYTFLLNRTDLLLNSGLAILWQSLDLEDESKLVKDNRKSLMATVGMLQIENINAAAEFQNIAACFMAIEARPTLSRSSTEQAPSPTTKVANTMAAPTESKTKSTSTRKQLQAIASRWSTFSSKVKPDDVPRRATVPQTGPTSVPHTHRAGSTVSLSSTRSAPVVMPMPTPSPTQVSAPGSVGSAVNLDYFPLGDDYGGLQSRTSSSTMLPPKKQLMGLPDTPGWDRLLDGYDPNETAFCQDMSTSENSLYQVSGSEWAPDSWQAGMDLPAKAPVPQSLLSFSEESLTSGEDFLFSTAGSHNGSIGVGDGLELADGYRGITIPVDDEFDFHE
jgi:hypothetical protein